MTAQTIQNAAHPSWCEPDDRCEDIGDGSIRHERIVGRVPLHAEPITSAAGDIIRKPLKLNEAEVTLWGYDFDGAGASEPLVSVVLPNAQEEYVDLTTDEALRLASTLLEAATFQLCESCGTRHPLVRRRVVDVDGEREIRECADDEACMERVMKRRGAPSLVTIDRTVEL